MRRFLLVLAGCLCISSLSFAQKITYHPTGKPTKAEGEFDKTVRTCITADFAELQGEKFSFADWLCTVQHYNNQMVTRMTAGFTEKIVSERTRAIEVGKLAQTCAALKAAKSELTKIAEIYEKNAKTGEEENSDGKAKIDIDSAKDLLKLSNKALEKLKITRKITDIR